MEEKQYNHPHFNVHQPQRPPLTESQRVYLEEYIAIVRMSGVNPVLVEILETILADYHPFS